MGPSWGCYTHTGNMHRHPLPAFPSSCLILLLLFGSAQRFQRELSTKWILNTVSTGAHLLKGKILRNYMVDLKVSNSKLFGRAVSILQVSAGLA